MTEWHNTGWLLKLWSHSMSYITSIIRVLMYKLLLKFKCYITWPISKCQWSQLDTFSLPAGMVLTDWQHQRNLISSSIRSKACLCYGNISRHMRLSCCISVLFQFFIPLTNFHEISNNNNHWRPFWLNFLISNSWCNNMTALQTFIFIYLFSVGPYWYNHWT